MFNKTKAYKKFLKEYPKFNKWDKERIAREEEQQNKKDKIAKIIMLRYSKKMFLKAIAIEMGVSKQTIERILKKVKLSTDND